MSDSGRSPFRRFPWVQLAFCLACLTMTGWTWMRYSYAWDFTSGGLGVAVSEGLWELEDLYPWQRPTSWPEAAYVRLWGMVLPGLVEIYPDQQYGPDFPGRKAMVYDPADKLAHVWLHCGDVDPASLRAQSSFCGRVTVGSGIIVVDMVAGRFCPHTIAGIVVGAMGCFIFGLYLRRWLRERRASPTTEITEVSETDSL